MSASNAQGSGVKEKHQNSNSKAKGPGSATSNISNTNNNATNIQTPRKAVGYTFNNGQEKQPIIRAQEYDPDEKHLTFNRDPEEATIPVGLNFNFWMEHSYIVDQQISNVITDFIAPQNAHKRSNRTNAIARRDLANIQNLVILSVQDVDPAELNDTINALPFLRNTTSLPIRHLHETSPSAASFDESVIANASGEQLWQYLDVANQNAMMLWTDRPSVPLSSLASVSTVELLTKYTLTFMSVHTQWTDEVVLYSDLSPSTGTNNPGTVAAFQEMARQKLVGCKDAPAYMLQMFCDLTKPPQPGDIFGRCNKAHAKETGMFLYRPGGATIKARFLVLWFRAKEIDVLEEVGSPQDAQNKCRVYPNSGSGSGGGDDGMYSRVYMKVVPEVVSKSRFHEQLDCVMTLQKAVLRDSNTFTAGVGNGTSVSATNGGAVDTTGATNTTNTTNTTITTTATTDNTHQYFDCTLQHTLRTQFSSSAFKSALETLVLSQPMQIIMGYTVSRHGGGNEDFIDTADGFYRKASPSVGFIEPVSAKSRVLMGFGEMEEGELEEGEEREEVDIEDSVVFNSIGGGMGSSMGVAGSVNGVNKKIYFPDHTTNTINPTTNTATTATNNTSSSDSSSSDEDNNMAVLLANNARKRKAQQQADNSEGSDSGGEEGIITKAPASPNKKTKPNTTTTATSSTTTTSATKPAPPPPPPPPPAPTNISDLISMYTPQALKTPGKTTTSTNTTTNSNNGGGPPLPFPLPTPTISINSTNTTMLTTTTTTTPQAPYKCTLVDTSTIHTPLEMVALDCEMCTTLAGLELTRLTVLCPLNGVVYDTLVRPELDIIDYHTEFSGITAEQLVNVTTTLRDVQNTLRTLISDRTIIVGHSADTDLKVLQLVHGRVIDTSALFPHPTGLPYKHSLKKLAKECLAKDIQDNGKDGHDSVQDAAIALELAFLKAAQTNTDSSNAGNGTSSAGLPAWLDDPVPKCSIFEPLLSGAGNETAPPALLRVSVHGVPSVIGYGTPVWEDYAFGYRPEGDSCLTLDHCRAALQDRLHTLRTSGVSNSEVERLEAQMEQLRSQKHGTTEEALAHALQDLRTLTYEATSNNTTNASNNTTSKSITIVEMRCGDENITDNDHHSTYSTHSGHSSPEHRNNGTSNNDRDNSDNMDAYDSNEYEQDGDQDDEGGPASPFALASTSCRPLTGLARVDQYVQQVYRAAPLGTVVLVVTQGSTRAMKQLASRKLRNRWEQAALKRKQSMVGSSRVPWDPSLDEGRLIAAAAHATAGAVFVVKK